MRKSSTIAQKSPALLTDTAAQSFKMDHSNQGNGSLRKGNGIVSHSFLVLEKVPKIVLQTGMDILGMTKVCTTVSGLIKLLDFTVIYSF